MKKIIIMISGRGSNMLAIAKNAQTGILHNVCEIKKIFSNNADALGLQYASELDISTQIIASKGKKKTTYNALLLEWLNQEKPDYIILAGYMKVIAAEIVQKFPKRIINIHPADTTLHQGLHGYEWAWENRLEETKVTVHFIDEGLDTGEIIAQKVVDIRGCQTLEDVESRGLIVEHKIYSECLKKIFEESS